MRRAAFIIAVLVLAGLMYEHVGRRVDRKRYPQIGRSVDIGGRALNIYCSGDGSPAVIFEGAGHTAGYAFAGMQAEAARFTRACWYDRAGYGWSDPAPSPRTFRAIASDLHALLHAAGIAPPYVLVGATAGASHVRVYNGMYPDEVAGAVLIHAADSDVFAHEPEFMKGSLARLPPIFKRFDCSVMRPVMIESGTVRLIGNPGAGHPYGVENLTPSQSQELIFLSNNAATAETEGEGCHLDESMAEVSDSGNFGNRPLVVLADSAVFRAPTPQYEKETAALNEYWFHQLQPRLAALSTRGRLVVRDDAERPESIVEAIRSVVRLTAERSPE